jgi:hypothetical protein
MSNWAQEAIEPLYSKGGAYNEAVQQDTGRDRRNQKSYTMKEQTEDKYWEAFTDTIAKKLVGKVSAEDYSEVLQAAREYGYQCRLAGVAQMYEGVRRALSMKEHTNETKDE